MFIHFKDNIKNKEADYSEHPEHNHKYAHYILINLNKKQHNLILKQAITYLGFLIYLQLSKGSPAFFFTKLFKSCHVFFLTSSKLVLLVGGVCVSWQERAEVQRYMPPTNGAERTPAMAEWPCRPFHVDHSTSGFLCTVPTGFYCYSTITVVLLNTVKIAKRIVVCIFRYHFIYLLFVHYERGLWDVWPVM